MAISWGAWSSNNRLRAGIEVTMSPSTLTASTTTVTLTTKVYLQTRYASSENGSSSTWFITGSGVTDGSGNTDWSLGDMGYKLMGSTTTSVTLTSSSQAKAASGRVHSYYAYAGTDASVSTTYTVPARAVAAPAAPISLSTSRVSDTSQKVSWTRQATTSAPYDSQIVYRKDNISTSLVAVATVTGTTTSWTDTKTVKDRVYTYAVRAKNAGGYSGYAYAPTIATTPAAPAAPKATKTTSGDISIARPALSGATAQWEVWHAAAGVWDTARLAVVAAATTTYTHTAPDPTKTHTYRLRGVSGTPVLTSTDGATSNAVQPLTPPASPTDLVPSGTAQEAAEAATFTWTHNALDTTAQSAYEVQWRPVATTTWTTTGKVASTSSARTWAANTWTNGQTIEWQVRTWGQHATASAWSASGTLTLSTRPVATITAPADGVAWDSARLRLDWTYGDAEGQVQTGWKVNLYAADGTVLESLAGADSTTSVRFATRLADGGSYSADVVVRDSTGLWSAADTIVFATDFATLPTPTVSAEFDVEAASCGVYVTVPVPVAPQVKPDSAEVWRSIDGGPWALVADNIVPTPLPDRVNAVTNPSFETDLTGWAGGGGGTVARVTTEAWTGAASLSLTGPLNAYANWVYTNAGTAITSNVSRVFSVYVKGTGSVQLELRGLNASNTTTVTAFSPTVTLTSSWQRVEVPLTADAATTKTWPIVWSRTASGTVYIDGALVEDGGTAAGSYIEGTVAQPSVFAVTDAIPALNASNRYKAVVETDMGAFGEGVPVEVFTSGVKHLFVNAGPGFADFVRVNSNVEVQLSTGRSRALRRAAGRDLPVPFDGQQVTTDVSVSATLWRPDRAQARASQASSWQDIADFALSYSPACFRDPDGNRVFVSMGPVRIAGLGTGPVRSVSWSMSAIDYAEPLVSSTTL